MSPEAGRFCTVPLLRSSSRLLIPGACESAVADGDWPVLGAPAQKPLVTIPWALGSGMTCTSARNNWRGPSPSLQRVGEAGHGNPHPRERVPRIAAQACCQPAPHGSCLIHLPVPTQSQTYLRGRGRSYTAQNTPEGRPGVSRFQLRS